MSGTWKFWSLDRTLGKTLFSGFCQQLHFILIQKGTYTAQNICPLEAYVGLR